jgi:DNA polymerase-3 subunit beta
MITVQRQNLLRSVERVAKFSDARSSMPALACVRIEWTGDTLQLTATNLTAYAVASVAGTGADAAWSALVSAKELIKALKSLPQEQIDMGQEGLQVEICASGCAIKVAGNHPSIWPTLTPPAPDLHPVNSAALAESLLSVLPAAGTDETRGHLMAVHVESDVTERTIFVATDGHRLDQIVRHDVSLPPTDEEGVSLPGPEISIVARLLRPTYPARWGWHEGHVTIAFDAMVVSCVLWTPSSPLPSGDPGCVQSSLE